MLGCHTTTDNDTDNGPDTAVCLVIHTKLSMNRGVMVNYFHVDVQQPDVLVSTVDVRHRNRKTAVSVRKYKRVK